MTLPSPAWRGRHFLAAAVWFAVLAGALESLSHIVYQSLFQGRIPLGLYLLWMPATGNLILFLVVAGLLILAWRRFPSVVTPARGVGVLAGLTALAALRKFDGLVSVVAVDLLAIGVGVQAARWLAPRLEGFRRHLRVAAPALLVLLVGLAAGVELHYRRQERRILAGLPAPPGGAANVLLLVLDTVRPQSLSLYGYERRTTPVMESLATRGARFDRAIATAPWTLPSHASLFTGRWQHELTADWATPLDGEYPTLAEVLGGRGYRTAGFVANLAYCGRNMGLDRGFSHYEGYRLTPTQVLRSAALSRWVTNWPFVKPLMPPMREDYHRKTAGDVNDALLRWLDRGEADRPFFAFLNYFDAHHDYLPLPPFDTLFQSPAYPPDPPARHGGVDPKERPRPMQVYDQAIAYLDHEIGRLLRELDRRGRLANTLVIITADHGEEFGEHGMYGHGHTLYMPGLAVPLVLLLPDRVPAGAVVPNSVSLRDLPATIQDLALGAAPDPFPGASLARFWLNPGAPADTLLAGARYAWNRADWYPTSKGDLHGTLSGELLYIREGDGRQELYDVARDPWQVTDLAPASDSALRLFNATLTRLVGPPTGPPGSR